MSNFKVGDKVRITEPLDVGDEDFAAGTVGTVRISNSAGIGVDFIKSDGEKTYRAFGVYSRHMNFGMIEKVETPEEEPLAQWEVELLDPGFSIGDKVRVKPQGHETDGTETYVEDVWEIRDGYKYHLEGLPGLAYRGVELEAVAEQKRPAVGDRVKIIEPGADVEERGGLGTVVKDDGTNYRPIQVKFDTDEWFNTGWYEPEHLEILEPEDEEAEAPPVQEEGRIEVGDTVELTGEGWSRHWPELGRTQVIKSIDRYYNGHPQGFGFKEGDSQFHSSDGEWELTKVEPKSEIENIKVGDRVKIIATGITGSGQTGTVTAVYESGSPWDVGVKPDDVEFRVAYHFGELELVEGEAFDLNEESITKLLLEALKRTGEDRGDNPESIARRLVDGAQQIGTFFSTLRAEQYTAGWDARVDGYEEGWKNGIEQALTVVRSAIDEIEDENGI